MTEKQKISTYNRYRIVKDRSRKLLPKPVIKQLPVQSFHSLKQKSLKSITNIENHPAEKYLFGTVPSPNDFKKFVTLLFQGLIYSVCSLKGPTDEYIRKKSIKLPQRKDSKQKFLMLDLDETLIHSLWGTEKAQISIKKGQQTIRFNIRPHCLQFLSRISNYFEVYVFTASTQDYAEPIVQYLNSKNKTIQGLLTRTNCLQTLNGFRIKDLRIIRNRSLSDIVIVDNLVHSFGTQLENGIPILQFTSNKEDTELLGLEILLMELKNVPDVRQFLARRLGLKKCLQINEEEFLNIGQRKGYRKA